MPEIGATLREARMRARIDISEIEATTKIRAKYLRALENEEWSLLPGPTFVKSFLRTYAQALGLDGKALVEEYRLSHEQPGEAGITEPLVPSGERRRGRSAPSGPSRGYLLAVGAVLGLIVLLIVLIVIGSSGSSSPSKSATHKSAKRHAARQHNAGASGTSAAAGAGIVSLSLRPAAVVYVCLIGEGGRVLIPGVELQPGTATRTYHARHFEINLGNSEVTMVIDGTPRTVPASNEAIGYSITKAHGRRPLAPGRLPTCK
jgi:cytoskeleton protein RodZ